LLTGSNEFKLFDPRNFWDLKIALFHVVSFNSFKKLTHRTHLVLSVKLNRLNEELMFDVLLFLFYLVERVHGKKGDPLHVEAGYDLVGHGRLAARAAAADPNDQWFNKFLS
jgi:hypothetical protein